MSVSIKRNAKRIYPLSKRADIYIYSYFMFIQTLISLSPRLAKAKYGMSLMRVGSYFISSAGAYRAHAPSGNAEAEIDGLGVELRRNSE